MLLLPFDRRAMWDEAAYSPITVSDAKVIA
jgi:hypothetical protein